MDNLQDNSNIKHNKQQIIVVLKYLLSKKIVITIAALIGLCIGATYALIKKPVYTAAITFSLQEDSKLSGGGLLSLASTFGLDAGASSGLFSGENIEQVFKSRKMIEQTLLQKYPIDTNRTFGDTYIDILNLRTKLKLPQPFLQKTNPTVPFNRLQDSIINLIYKYVNLGYLEAAKPDKKFDIYEVSFKCSDESFSKFFSQELVKQVAIFYTETKTKKTKQNVDVLQKRVDSIRNAIGTLMYQKATDADANVNPIFQMPKVTEQRKQIDMTALGAGYGELLKNLELARYTLLKETPLFQVIDEPKFPLKKKEYSLFVYGPLLAVLFAFLAIGWLVCRKLFSSLIDSLKG